MTLQQAITELATLTPCTHVIDMEYWHHSTGTTTLEWTITVHLSPLEQYKGQTLDEAMTAARAALRPVAVRDAVAAADGAMG